MGIREQILYITKAEGKAEGLAEGEAKLALAVKNLSANGFSTEQIAGLLELSKKKV